MSYSTFSLAHPCVGNSPVLFQCSWVPSLPAFTTVSLLCCSSFENSILYLLISTQCNFSLTSPNPKRNIGLFLHIPVPSLSRSTWHAYTQSMYTSFFIYPRHFSVLLYNGHNCHMIPCEYKAYITLLCSIWDKC